LERARVGEAVRWTEWVHRGAPGAAQVAPLRMGLEKNVRRKEKKRRKKRNGKKRKGQRTDSGRVPTALPFPDQHTCCRTGTAPIDDAAPLRPGVPVNRPVRLSSKATQRNATQREP
jgi:hypothetical protein